MGVQYPFIQAVDIEVLDLGEQPPAIGGAKSYATSNDEAVLEAPVMWGGDARVRVAVRVKLGGFVLYLPVEVRDLQATHASCPSSIHGLIPMLEYSECSQRKAGRLVDHRNGRGASRLRAYRGLLA